MAIVTDTVGADAARTGDAAFFGHPVGLAGIYFLSVFAGSLLVGWVGQFYERMTASAFWLLHAGAAGMAGLIVVVLWKPLSIALLTDRKAIA